jgi:hypothetical protein
MVGPTPVSGWHRLLPQAADGRAVQPRQRPRLLARSAEDGFELLKSLPVTWKSKGSPVPISTSPTHWPMQRWPNSRAGCSAWVVSFIGRTAATATSRTFSRLEFAQAQTDAQGAEQVAGQGIEFEWLRAMN